MGNAITESQHDEFHDRISEYIPPKNSERSMKSTKRIWVHGMTLKNFTMTEVACDGSPKLGIVKYARTGEIGTCYTASVLRRKLLEGEVHYLDGGMYRERDGNRSFELHCINCHGLECESSRINKLGEFGGAGTGYWQQFFVHSSVQQQNHNHTCQCVEENIGGGGGPSVKRRFLSSGCIFHAKKSPPTNSISVGYRIRQT